MNCDLKKQLEDRLIQLYNNTSKSSVPNMASIMYSKGYIEEYPLELALNDIDMLAKLSTEHVLELSLYQSDKKEINSLQLRLFEWNNALPLSDIVPMLEHFGLRTIGVRSHNVHFKEGHIIWISDFTLSYAHPKLMSAEVSDLFKEAFSKVYLGLSENDGFNQLILGASLSSQEIIILRALTKYLIQIAYRFGQLHIEKTLSNNTSLSIDLIRLFKTRHDPCLHEDRELLQAAIEQKIIYKLKSVTNLDEDRIINQLIALIKATVRTTFFQKNLEGQPKPYLAIKFDSAAIPGLRLPLPLYEIFVYSHSFEGIHLRKEKIARGGIRWSERPDDFRREVLDLMKAQVVKNSLIVPSGAKGGFVLKLIPALASRDIIRQAVIHAYQLFISALLDLTDNIKEGQNIPPKEVICHDPPDPYLVVAADKGTATFSDIANGLSKSYDFWLDDAFASGGSTGYDHKKMGITARGTWESIKRHFHEMDYDIINNDICVVGIGDMSGDVFGNGMLYTNRIKLVAAFDHRHIFLDPNPVAESAFNERVRLFNLPSSSWEDYDAALISTGGGVFSHSLKSIPLSPEMQQVLSIDVDFLTPQELIRAILKAPVDLLFNGGIGTFVKSSNETQLEAGDRNNDDCRVNGNELRCKVVAEGGNLGFTQRGRIEYAANGGLINTDFIDNSAGVNCSDHEVNLKILLNQEKMSDDQRNTLLASLTDEIAQLVLNDNQKQALVLSYSAFSNKKNITLHTEYIRELEALNILNRQIEFLPSDKELIERKTLGLGLTRPELATLIAYTKIYVKQEILNSNVPEDSYLNQIIETAFPPSIKQQYANAMQQHLLKRDIIATQLSNNVVNQMGITYVYRMQIETGATVDEIIRAYVIASHIFGTEKLKQVIVSLNYKLPMTHQFEIFHHLRKLLNLSTRWFLRGNYIQFELRQIIEHFSTQIQLIETDVPELMSGLTKAYMEIIEEEFIKANIPNKTARRIATYRAIYSVLNIIEITSNNHLDLRKTTAIYFAGGERMGLVWFRDTINSDTREDHWHALTRLTLRDELDALQKAITLSIVSVDEGETDVNLLIDKWMGINQRAITRWEKFLTVFHENTNVEYSMFFIAIRELSVLLKK